MTTTTSTTTTEEALAAAERAADEARGRALELRAQVDAEQAAEEARAASARDRDFERRRRDWPTTYSRARTKAREAFVDAVRSGGDPIAAWAAYSTADVVAAHEWAAIEGHRYGKEKAHYERFHTVLEGVRERLQTGAFMQLSASAAGSSEGWRADEAEDALRAANAELNALAEEYGSPLRQEPLATTAPVIFEFGVRQPHMPLTIGEKSEKRTFAQALEDAFRTIEREAIAAHEDRLTSTDAGVDRT